MAYKKKTNDGVRGRPTVLTQKAIETALMLREKGFTILEIAQALGISEQLLYLKGSDWEKLRRELNIIKARQEAEKINKVSKALYDRAVGQKVKIKKEVLTKGGDIVELKEVREIAGDVKAQQFYLINRDPQNWKIQPEEIQGAETGAGSIKIQIVEGEE